MKTYHILTRNVKVDFKRLLYDWRIRKDFAELLMTAIPSKLLDDLADDLASRLHLLHPSAVRKALERTLDVWRDAYCEPNTGKWIPKVGDEVYHKTFRSITRIDRVRAVRKAGELGFIYHTKDYGSWYTQAKLEEDFLPVEEDCDGN